MTPKLEASNAAVELVNSYLVAIENLMIANNQRRPHSICDEKRETKNTARDNLLNYIAKLEERIN